MKKILAALMFTALALTGAAAISPAVAAAPASAPITSTVEAESLAVKQVAAMRVASCPNNRLCFYPCPLSSGCSYSYSVASTTTSCVNIFAKNLAIYAVKNETSYRFKVYHSSNCGTVGSYFYPESDGDMNYEWAEDGIGSVKRG